MNTKTPRLPLLVVMLLVVLFLAFAPFGSNAFAGQAQAAQTGGPGSGRVSPLPDNPLQGKQPASSPMGQLQQHMKQDLIPADAGQWQPLGPQPINEPPWQLDSGRITAEGVNPSNPNDVWVGAADGGLWHSTSGGGNWQPVPTAVAVPVLGGITISSFPIGAITIDPNRGNPYTIYAGTGEANGQVDALWGDGVLISTDGGTTWSLSDTNANGNTPAFDGMGIGKIVVDPGTMNGIRQNNVLLLTTVTVANPGPPTGPASTTNNNGIWQSTNFGATWNPVKGQTLPSGNWGSTPGTDVLFDPSDATGQTAYAGLAGYMNVSGSSNSAGVYKSTDEGATWNRIEVAPLPFGNTVGRVSLGISQNGQKMYVVMADQNGHLLGNGIYLSANNGAAWQTQAEPAAMVNNNGQWWYDSYVAVDPADPTGKIAYIGGVDIWWTENGGSFNNLTLVFRNPPRQPVHPDQHALAFNGKVGPGGHTFFYIGNDGGAWGAYYTQDLKIHFNSLNVGGLNISQFYAGGIGEIGAAAQLYGGSQDNGVDQYPPGSTGAVQWNEAHGGDGGSIAVDYTNNAVVYAEVHVERGNARSPGIYQSTDGGATWNPANTGINRRDPTSFLVPLVMSPNNNMELFTGTDKVYRTTDGATGWNNISGVLDGTTPISALAVAPSDDNYVYAGDNAGRVFVTTNANTTHTWTQVTPANTTGGKVTSIAVDPTNPQVVYVTYSKFATGAGQHVFAGTLQPGPPVSIAWTDISAGLPNVPFDSALVVNSGVTPSCNAGKWLVVGSDIGVWCSVVPGNGGKWNWQPLGSGLPSVAIDQVFANHTDTKLFLATHGRGMWTLPLPACAPTGAERLTGTATVNSTDVWAVGYCSSNNGINQTLTEHWNGASWSVVPSPSPGPSGNELTAVAVVSTNDVWAVGYSNNGTLTEHWDGNSWSVVASPGGGSLNGVAVVSTSDVWAVGYVGNQTLTEHWDGNSWSVVASPGGGSLNGVAVVSTNDVWAVGYSNNISGTLTEHWDGSSWSVVASPNPSSTQNSLQGVAVVSTSDVWAVGYYANSNNGTYQTLTEHWNGNSWSIVASPNIYLSAYDFLYGVAVVSASDVWAVGFYSNGNGNAEQTLTEHWDGNSWSIVSSPNVGFSSNYLFGVAVVSTSDVWAVGYVGNQTLTEHWDGNSWKVIPSP